MEQAITILEEYYREHGTGRSMEWTYGFMDALAALREIVNEDDILRQNSRRLCGMIGPSPAAPAEF